MTLRCRECHKAIWVQPDESTETVTVTCRECGKRYELGAKSRLLMESRHLSHRARTFAKTSVIDLAGAYSVLLGIMTTEEVRALSRKRTSSDDEAIDFTAGARASGYDPAFQPAVDAGWLTARQAKERGRRDTYVTRLRNRHGLSAAAAAKVADNRITLLEAIRRREAEARQPQGRGQEGSLVRTLALGVLLAAALVGLAVSRQPGTTLSNAQVNTLESRGTAEYLTDSEGRLVEVRGPSPRSVLEGYCSAVGAQRSLEPLDLAPSSLPGPRSRLGLFRDKEDPTTLLSITIWEDIDGGRWVAGNEGKPLVAEVAPPGAERSLRRR